jgi:aminopeptidase YwaD
MTDHSKLLAHLRALVGERHPSSSLARLFEAQTYLSRQFSEIGFAVTKQPFQALGRTYHNVIGTTIPDRGSFQSAAPLILAAHFDTVQGSPGADDNASALAVMLYVAGQIRNMKLVRPVRFIAFNLEEENLLGSQAYTEMLQKNGEPIYGAIVLECVGYASHQANSQRIPPGIPITVPTTGNFLAVIGNERSQSLTGSVAQAMKPHLPIVPLVVTTHPFGSMGSPPSCSLIQPTSETLTIIDRLIRLIR